MLGSYECTRRYFRLNFGSYSHSGAVMVRTLKKKVVFCDAIPSDIKLELSFLFQTTVCFIMIS